MTDLKIKLVKLLSSSFKWDVQTIAYSFELHNGWGYRKYRGINSPYLWSFSNHYKKGKYAYDGKYDPGLVSKQKGAMVLLRALMDKEIKLLEREKEQLLEELEKVPDEPSQPTVKKTEPLVQESKWGRVRKCVTGWFK